MSLLQFRPVNRAASEPQLCPRLQRDVSSASRPGYNSKVCWVVHPDFRIGPTREDRDEPDSVLSTKKGPRSRAALPL